MHVQKYLGLFVSNILIWTAQIAAAETIAIGITEPIRDVTLSMTTSGIVESQFVKEGSRVSKNDVLLELDRDIENLEMQSKKLLFEDQSIINELRSRIEILEYQLSRGKALLARGSISEKQIEDEELALLSAQAELRNRIQTKHREKIDYELANTYFKRRQLIAPIDGIVTEINVSVGETTKTQEPLISVVDVSRIKFRGTFAVNDPYGFNEGDVAELIVNQAGSEIVKRAIVVYVAPVADPSSGLIEVIAEADNSDGIMIPGTTASLVSKGGLKAP